MKSSTPIVSFQVLLASMILLLIVPTLVSAGWSTTISKLLYTFTMISSLYLVSTNRRELVIGIILFFPAITTKWMLAPVVSIKGQVLANCIFQVVFLAYIMKAVYRHLMTTKEVDAELLYASVILYLMFGVCMAITYYGILIMVPGTFGGDIVIDLSDPIALTAILNEMLYFSFVTQTTLGYGDVLPELDVVRTLATFQAIIGQLYIAVIVARLVGIQIASRTMGQNGK